MAASSSWSGFRERRGGLLPFLFRGDPAPNGAGPIAPSPRARSTRSLSRSLRRGLSTHSLAPCVARKGRHRVLPLWLSRPHCTLSRGGGVAQCRVLATTMTVSASRERARADRGLLPGAPTLLRSSPQPQKGSRDSAAMAFAPGDLSPWVWCHRCHSVVRSEPSVVDIQSNSQKHRNLVALTPRPRRRRPCGAWQRGSRVAPFHEGKHDTV